MPTKIDDRTSVPVVWLVMAIMFACTGAWTTAAILYTLKFDIKVLKKDVRKLKKKAGLLDPGDEIDTDDITENFPFKDATAGGK